jgi:hypothetical protein
MKKPGKEVQTAYPKAKGIPILDFAEFSLKITYKLTYVTETSKLYI